MDEIDISNVSIQGEGVRDPNKDQESLKSFVAKLIQDDMNLANDNFVKEYDCSLLMTKYLARYGKEPQDDYTDVVRPEFMISNDWDLKKKIIEDALNKGITLEESSYYPGIQEGVREEEHFFR